MSADAKTVDGQLFREAMSRIAGHVHVVATGGPAGLSGVTATAVTSVSDAPPSMLVCLNAGSRTLEHIRINGRFGINALPAAMEAAARIFAGEGGFSGAQRFRAEDGWDLATPAPRLRQAMAYFDCAVTDMTVVGTHVILIGRVEAALAGDDVPPLMYHRREYWGA